VVVTALELTLVKQRGRSRSTRRRGSPLPSKGQALRTLRIFFNFDNFLFSIFFMQSKIDFHFALVLSIYMGQVIESFQSAAQGF